MEIINVKITNVSLTMADHGCLTFYITVEGAGIGVNLGGYCIGTGYLGAKEFSAESGDGLVAMMNIMNVVGVHKWEDLKGKYCRIKIDGLGSTVSIIGNITENQWFDMKKFFEEYGDKQAESEKRKGQMMIMTAEEVRNQLEELIKDRESFMVGDYDKDIYDRDKEALELAVKIVEKQIPKKPNNIHCPICKRPLRKAKEDIGYTGKVKKRKADNYCPSCGQALDWSEVKDYGRS